MRGNLRACRRRVRWSRERVTSARVSGVGEPVRRARRNDRAVVDRPRRHRRRASRPDGHYDDSGHNNTRPRNPAGGTGASIGRRHRERPSLIVHDRVLLDGLALAPSPGTDRRPHFSFLPGVFAHLSAGSARHFPWAPPRRERVRKMTGATGCPTSVGASHRRPHRFCTRRRTVTLSDGTGVRSDRGSDHHQGIRRAARCAPPRSRSVGNQDASLQPPTTSRSGSAPPSSTCPIVTNERRVRTKQCRLRRSGRVCTGWDAGATGAGP